MVITALLEGKNMDSIYCDFQKAFDKCDINMVAHALRKSGIQGNIGTWILDFMSNRSQYVITNNSKSRKEVVLSGVPQLSILGLVIFVLGIQSLAELEVNGELELFADNAKASHPVTDLTDVAKLQDDLVNLNDWTQIYSMYFNSDKFNCIKTGYNEDIKMDYTYLSLDLDIVIEDKDTSGSRPLWAHSKFGL